MDGVPQGVMKLEKHRKKCFEDTSIISVRKPELVAKMRSLFSDKRKMLRQNKKNPGWYVFIEVKSSLESDPQTGQYMLSAGPKMCES